MIIQKTQTQPGMRSGYLCTGQVTSANTGIISITFTSNDVSAKITGIVLTPIYNEAAKLCVCQLTSVAYSGGVTTILGRVFASDDIATPAFSLTDAIVVNYSFWVDDASLPADQTTNKPSTENL